LYLYSPITYYTLKTFTVNKFHVTYSYHNKMFF
jgi:hypothetical protein